MPKKTLVLFEDNPIHGKEVNAAFEKEFKGSGIAFHPFSPNNPKSKESTGGSYVERLKGDLKSQELGDIILFVTDRDLSTTNGYTGLSESVVSSVSDEWAIPMCIYSQAEKPDALRRARSWSDFKILLDIRMGKDKIAAISKIFCLGFEQIGAACQKIGHKNSTLNTPAEILATLLKEPELKDRIALYGAGDQHMLSEILPFYERGKSRKQHLIALQPRMKRALGYWLWDSIMRFPGIFLNEVAAASYLDIAESDFAKETTRTLFKSALYSGPFSGVEILWWRHKIDALLAKAGCKSGREYAVQKNLPNISSAKCSVDQKNGAGYYCMVSKKPICEKHARSNISWFPPGADLARISTPIFDELAPWLGLYN